MSVGAAPSIFDSFNARNLSPEEVAKRFVPSEHFEMLAKQAHTIVIGPRGSGKTTLLKMLHPSALYSWDHPRAAEFRDRIRFIGVFVALDLNWSRQIEALGLGRLDAISHELFERAAFTSHVLHSFVESVAYVSGRFGAGIQPFNLLSRDDETQICKELIAAWRLDHALPSLLGLRHALSQRFSEIEIVASREAHLDSGGRAERLAATDFLHVDFLRAAQLAVELVNDRASEPGRRWALLFDELELAPAWVTAALVRFIRSVDERFLFKLSLSPYSSQIHLSAGPDDPTQRNDFDEIRLWYVHKEAGYPFCRDLLAHMLAGRGIREADPDRLFGRSVFATGPAEWSNHGTAYRPGSAIARRFVRLAEKDESFRRYLAEHEIDLNELQGVGSVKRAADIRKVTSIVAIRDYFMAGPGSGSSSSSRRRSRKVPTIYAGASALFAMVEGNPRWLIGIVGSLLETIQNGKEGVDGADQVSEVLSAGNVFRAMLRTVPCPPVGQARRGLLGILDPIGEYFARAVIDEPFDPEPHGSFVVDSTCSSELLDALGKALNTGAVVYVPDKEDSGLLQSLRGKRFRLSYLLAPHYHLPLLLGRQISLARILDAETAPVSEPTLFDSESQANG